MPTLTIFAGINGAGKSTLYKFQKTTKVSDLGVRICPDEIVEEMGGDWTNFVDVVNSGKIAIRRIDDCIKNKQSFNWETTLISRISGAMYSKTSFLALINCARLFLKTSISVVAFSNPAR